MKWQFIGKASADSGLSDDTIRFYEKIGLIGHLARTKGKFRTFGIEDMQQLRLIRRLVDLGFSLDEIKCVLGLRHKKMDACTAARDLLQQKLVNVRIKIRMLRLLEQELQRACTR